jgi:hypothetical protein
MSARGLAITAAIAVAVLWVTLAAVWKLWPGDYAQGSDTEVYYGYGRSIVDGLVPYRDFEVPYPPGALPAFVLPATRVVALGSTKGADFHPLDEIAQRYSRTFAGLMALSGAATIAFTALSLAALGRGRRESLVALGLLGLAALLVGGLLYTRFDLWPAALTAAALAALLRGRFYLAAAVLGCAIAVKLYPAVLLPLAVAYAWRRSGRRAAFVSLGIGVAAAALVFLPFVVVSPGGVADALEEQLTRGLQVESVGSIALVVVSHVASFDLRAEAASTGLKTQELVGPGTDGVAAALSVIRVLALVAVWAAFAGGQATRERLVRYAAASLVALVALGPVLSPEYVIWLLPAVVLVGGLRGLVSAGLLAAAAIATHVWFPTVYDVYVDDLSLGPTALLALKELLLLTLLAVLVWPGFAGDEAEQPAQPVSQTREPVLAPHEA